MYSISLFLLGRPRYSRDGQPGALTSAKANALLGLLAAARAPQHRERLMDLLWPDSLPEAARKNLRNTLWTIRRELGEGVIATTSDRLALEESAWVDLWALEEAARAAEPSLIMGPEDGPVTLLDLYGGTFLEGLTLTDAPDLELWLSAERERIEQLFLRLLDRQVERYRAEADWVGMLAMAQRALALDNLQESMVRASMEAHARRGERSEALRQYDLLHATLDRELGVAPLPETDALRTAVMEGTLLPDSPTPSHRLRREAARADAPAMPYIGRHAERETLDGAFRAAAGGETRVAMMTGEVGIGKSRLWQEWSTGLPRETILLEAHCLHATQSLPLAPIAELFGRDPALRALFSPSSPVAPVWLAEVTRLQPGLRTVVPNLVAPPALPPAEERHRLFEALTQCLRALDGRPLVLFVDDLHWADRTTLDWLSFLTDRLSDEPFLLVGAYRPEDAPASLAQAVAGWGRDQVLTRLSLSRLTEEEVRALVTALGADSALSREDQQRSGGNPYFLIEMCRTSSEDIPPVLADLVRARLDRLSASARQVVQAAAILEPDVDFVTLRRTSGRGEEETLDALDDLLESGILVEWGEHYAFAQPLVAMVVRDGLSAARRAFLHRRAAEALETTPGANLPPIAGRLAHHLEQAGVPERAAFYTDMAAEHALSLSASQEAANFYRRSISLQHTPERLLALGQVLLPLGDLEEGRGALLEALDGFQDRSDSRGIIRSSLAIAESYVSVGRRELVLEWVARGLSQPDIEDDPEAHARAHFLLATVLLQTDGSFAEAERELQETTRLAMENDLPAIAARGRFELGNLQAQRGDLAAAVESYQETIKLAERAGDVLEQILGHNNAAYHLLLMGDLATARNHIQSAMDIAEGGALRLPLQYLYSTRGELALAEAQWEEAEEWFVKGIEETRRNDNRAQMANYQANLALAARGRGDLDAALIMLERAREEASTLTTPHLSIQIELWLTELYLERGEQSAAREALSRAENRLARGERGRLRAWAAELRNALPLQCS